MGVSTRGKKGKGLDKKKVKVKAEVSNKPLRMSVKPKACEKKKEVKAVVLKVGNGASSSSSKEGRMEVSRS